MWFTRWAGLASGGTAAAHNMQLTVCSQPRFIAPGCAEARCVDASFEDVADNCSVLLRDFCLCLDEIEGAATVVCDTLTHSLEQCGSRTQQRVDSLRRQGSNFGDEWGGKRKL